MKFNFFFLIQEIFLFLWASLVAQMVKNPSAIWETWIQSLGWEDTLEEGMATHSSILVQKITMDRGTWWATVHGVTESDTTEGLTEQHFILYSGLSPQLLFFRPLSDLFWDYFSYLMGETKDVLTTKFHGWPLCFLL